MSTIKMLEKRVAEGDTIEEKFNDAKNRPFVQSSVKQKKKGIFGLFIVTIGFVLQIVALWI